MNAKSSVPVGNISNKKDLSEPAEIRAKDVLVKDFAVSSVICVTPEKTVREVALLLTNKKISAVSVVAVC